MWCGMNTLEILKTFIPLLNLLIVIYIFSYTKKKDTRELKRVLTLENQKITLQWFKELILQPNLSSVIMFYEKVDIISKGLLTKNLGESEKIEITDQIKSEASKIRKSFINLLQITNSGIDKQIGTNIDNLVDHITETVFNDGINLEHPPEHEKQITNHIIKSKTDLMSLLYSFKGNNI